MRKNLSSQSNQSVTGSGAQSDTGPAYTAVNTTQVARHDENQATGFLQDAEERVYEPFPMKLMNPTGMAFGLDNLERRSIAQMLQTPVNIRSVTLSSATSANSTILSFTLPFDSSNNGFGTDSGQGMWSQRLNAYQGFKATAVVNFQVNVNRFAQGRLLCHYIPGQNAQTTETATHRFDLCTKSQTPNVQINLNRDTSTEMRIPYVSSWPCYDLTRSGGSLTMNTANGVMGIVYVVVYSPLVGTTSLPLNVWLHFEDVELFNPTYAPQGNLQDDETPSGVFSGPLNTLSKAAGVAAQIPALSSIAKPAEWFLRASSMAARAFGFAKPDSEARLTRLINQNNPYFANGDGEMATYKLGISCSNKLDVLPGFAGNDIDEMSTEYICNRTAFEKSFNWASSDVQGTSLTTQLMGPDAFSNNYTVAANNNIYTYIPFSFIAQYFTNWRMDFVITLKVIKTEFHTGRLAVSFRPGYTSAATAVQEAYLSRVIVDIKESDTFVITVPYCSLTPFLARNVPMGILNVSVLNPLNAPSSVSNSVSIIMEASAKNVHFNGIEKQTFAPVTGNNASWTPQGNFETQGDFEEAPREKEFVMPGLNLEEGKALESSRFTCGEAFTSIKQLLNRFNISRYSLSASNTNRNLTFQPFVLGGIRETTGSYVYGPFGGDALSAFSSMYVLARGSIRYAFFNRSGNDSNISVYTGVVSGQTPMLFSGAATTSLSSAIPTTKGTNGVSDVITVNQWSLTHSRQADSWFDNSTRSTALGEPLTLVSYSSIAAWDGTNLSLYRSAGDDYQLGFLIGVPVMYRDISVGAV